LSAREDKFAREGLTFDDVLLVPAESGVLPNDVSTATRIVEGTPKRRSRFVRMPTRTPSSSVIGTPETR